MTRNGEASWPLTPAHRTPGSGSSSSHAPQPDRLLPTPEAKLADHGPDLARANREGSGGDDLKTAVHRALLPTPKATDGTKGGPNQRGSSGDLTLPSAVQPARLLPTPQARDHKGQGHVNRSTRPDTGRDRGTGDDGLPDLVARGMLLPTPTAQDGSNVAGPSQLDRNTPPLNAAVRLLPTPVATDANGSGGRNGPGSKAHPGVSLSDALCFDGDSGSRTLLPTPSAADGIGGHVNRSGDRADELLLNGVARAAEAGQLLPTPVTDPDSANGHARNLRTEAMLLPTPNPFHLDNTETPDGWLERRADVEARTGTRHGPALPVVVASAEAGTPLVQDGTGPHLVPCGDGLQWGPYAAAVEHWSAVFRPAPAPTEIGPKGGARLSPRFVEWMQGLPDGWVTAVPGLTRNEQLKALGNGVVPPQAILALTDLLGDVS